MIVGKCVFPPAAAGETDLEAAPRLGERDYIVVGGV
ncbi:hypothetical protein Tco_1065319, partial [Tanacetum coccineum]